MSRQDQLLVIFPSRTRPSSCHVCVRRGVSVWPLLGSHRFSNMAAEESSQSVASATYRIRLEVTQEHSNLRKVLFEGFLTQTPLHPVLNGFRFLEMAFQRD